MLARECASLLLEKDMYKLFCDEFGSKIEDIVRSSMDVKTQSCSKRRENLWTMFYQYRSEELVSWWKGILLHLKMPKKYGDDPWLIQVVSRISLEKFVSRRYSALPSDSSACSEDELTENEKLALRYAAGYVLLSLKRKFLSIDPSLSAWIGKQTDSSFSGGSYTQFTKMWVEKVNRGGLFKISDSVYEVFMTLELVLRQFLKCMSDEHGLDRSKVTDVLFEDNEVQFHWSMMTFDIDEKSSQKALKEVIKLWVTIRGFRYASCIVEEYKRSYGALKRQKALRKELKSQSSDTVVDAAM